MMDFVSFCTAHLTGLAVRLPGKHRQFTSEQVKITLRKRATTPPGGGR
jgi:hypothetical protein